MSDGPLRLVLASGNAGKLRELNALLAGSGVIAAPLSAFTEGQADETGSTFVENAILKARHACEHSGLPSVADDSGLIVTALGGAPGVHSARYGGPGSTDQGNCDKLLRELWGVPPANRGAMFISVVVYMSHAADPLPVVTEGRWAGHILEAPRGENGFGYDPLFGLADGRSAAELEPDEKNRRSHRALALADLLALSPWRQTFAGSFGAG